MSSSSIRPSHVHHRLLLHVRELIKLCWNSSISVLKAPKKEHRADSTPGRPLRKTFQQLILLLYLQMRRKFHKMLWKFKLGNRLSREPGREPRSKLAWFGINEDSLFINFLKLVGVLKASQDLELITNLSALFILLLWKRGNFLELSEVNNEWALSRQQRCS